MQKAPGTQQLHRAEDFTAGDLKNVPLEEAIGNMVLALKGMGVTMSSCS